MQAVPQRYQAPTRGRGIRRYIGRACGWDAHSGLRPALVGIRRALIRVCQNGWRPPDRIRLNDPAVWRWSRACCRITRTETGLIVCVDTRGAEITSVRAQVHGNILAIRIELACQATLLRAQPLPIAVHENVGVRSWDDAAARIELRIRGTI